MTTFDLLVHPPFNLGITAEILRRRQNHLAEVVVDGEFFHVFDILGQLTVLAVKQNAANVLQVRSPGAELSTRQVDVARTAVSRLLGVDFDVVPLMSALEREPAVYGLATQLTGLRPPRFETLWHALLGVVPFQQVSLAAGTSMVNRLVQALGIPYKAKNVLCFAYPSPETLLAAGEEKIRLCGFSGAKTRTLLAGATAIVEGTLNELELESLADEDAITRLIRLPGIGRWSAQVLLLRGFRRLAIFPQGDSGASKTIHQFLAENPSVLKRTAEDLLDGLGEYRGYLYFLLLGWRLLRSGVIAPPDDELLTNPISL